MHGLLAHIIDGPVSAPIAWASLLTVVATVGFVAWLVVEHHLVKYGRFEPKVVARTAAALGALALTATLVPAPADGQDREIPVGLPDLVSEPPIIWFDKIVEYDDGTIAKVLAFDGYLHNIGDGVLDVAGNPQVPGDVKQRWYDGEEWIEVAAPRVIYETTDDHNHFHLMAAAEYELWNEARTEKIGDSAKVGFCLLDTEQLSERYDAFYDIDIYDYCEQDDPESTELRMGISPGWVDTYDANTTLQWVDVSNTTPGRYWVAAIMDPEDQIVESNEDNNGHVFSTTTFAVTGWAARPLPPQAAGEPIVLKADGFGTVGERAWVIVEPPSNGTLSVPSGVDVFAESIVYTPDEGFTGTDSFSYIAADVDSPYPLEPEPVVVEVDASDYSGPTTAGVPAEVDDVAVTGVPERLDASVFVAVDLSLTLDTDGDASWFARGLPAGLAIDEASGRISGVPTVQGEGIAEVLAVVDDGIVATTFPWTVALPSFDERPSLDDVGHVSSPRYVRVNRYIGSGAENAEYSATGVPDGVRMVDNIPLLTGDPAEAGTFDIVVTETVDGEVTNTAAFTWTIRPTPYPEFPL